MKEIAEKKLVYLITDGETASANFTEKKTEILDKIRRAVDARISLIQIREKKLSAKLLFELAREAAEITKNSKTKLLVSDRADIALAAKADGVHLTENSLSAAVVRRNFPAHLIVGVSVHSLEKAQKAQAEAADFAVFSPVFASPNKGEPQGLDALREICEKLKPFPIIALGGIDEMNYKSVLNAGASGFAAIRFLNDFLHNTGNLKTINHQS